VAGQQDVADIRRGCGGRRGCSLGVVERGLDQGSGVQVEAGGEPEHLNGVVLAGHVVGEWGAV
jgi:hypothetical protein